MPKDEKILAEGVVRDMHPNAKFSIELTSPEELKGYVTKGYIAGKMRMNYIRIIPGDKVSLELNLGDLTQGRIIFRNKEGGPGFTPRHKR